MHGHARMHARAENKVDEPNSNLQFMEFEEYIYTRRWRGKLEYEILDNGNEVKRQPKLLHTNVEWTNYWTKARNQKKEQNCGNNTVAICSKSMAQSVMKIVLETTDQFIHALKVKQNSNNNHPVAAIKSEITTNNRLAHQKWKRRLNFG